MSGSAVKATRRQLRRAMGTNGVMAVSEAQTNINQLANSLTNAHHRIDQLELRCTGLMEALIALREHVKKIY